MMTRAGGIAGAPRKIANCFAAAIAAILWCGAGQAASGIRSLTVTPSEFPLRLDQGQRHLVTATGKPFLIHGDTAWSLIAQLSREDALAYLDDRAARGFNTLLVNLIEHRFASKAPANAYGDRPFVIPGKLSGLNDAYFDHAVWVMKRAAERGFIVLLAPTYAGAGGGDEGWYRAMHATGNQDMATYADYIVRRFGGLPNVIWVHGGDYDVAEKRPIEIVARHIHDALPSTIATAHIGPESNVDEFWRGAGWFQLSNVYTYGRVQPAAIAHVRRTPRPFFLMESAYENEHGAGAKRVRMQAYDALLSGAVGHLFGNSPIWHFGSKDGRSWRAALDSPGTRSMMRLAELLGQVPWWRLRPDIEGSFLQADPTLPRDLPSAVAATASDGTLALVYVPTSRSITVDLSRLSKSRLNGFWHDPETPGAPSVPLSVETLHGVTQLQPPSAAGRRDEDWLLELRVQE